MTALVAPTSKFTRAVPFGFNPLTMTNRVASFIAGRGCQIATNVSGWIDAAIGNTIVQATAGKQPVFGAATGPNSQAAITFDGVDDFLALAFTLPQPVHALIVAKYTSSGTAGTLLDGSNNNMRIFRTGTAQMSMFAGTQRNFGSMPDLTLWHLHEGFFSGASSFYKIDGTGGTTGDSGSAAGGAITLGIVNTLLADPGACSVAEAHFFSAQKTGTELTNFKAYISLKFGLTLS